MRSQDESRSVHMHGSNFWPKSDKYEVHVLQLEPPKTLSDYAKTLIHETLALTDMLRTSQNTGHQRQGAISGVY